MNYKSALLLIAVFSICACDRHEEAPERREIGRFQYYPPAGEMPAVLLDTATGCVEVFVPMVALENPKNVRWNRQYEDAGLPIVTYENGKPVDVPNTVPPQRCEQLKKANK